MIDLLNEKVVAEHVHSVLGHPIMPLIFQLLMAILKLCAK